MNTNIPETIAIPGPSFLPLLFKHKKLIPIVNWAITIMIMPIWIRVFLPNLANRTPQKKEPITGSILRVIGIIWERDGNISMMITGAYPTMILMPEKFWRIAKWIPINLVILCPLNLLTNRDSYISSCSLFIWPLATVWEQWLKYYIFYW